MLLDDLLTLEHHGWDALCRGTGADFYGDLMTEDGVMVLAHGVVLSRTGVLSSLVDAPAWDRYEIREPRLIAADESTATLVYTADALRSADPPFHALMASTYTRRQDRWRLLVHQQTPVPRSAETDR